MVFTLTRQRQSHSVMLLLVLSVKSNFRGKSMQSSTAEDVTRVTLIFNYYQNITKALDPI